MRDLAQHNPVWLVELEDGTVRRVYACDEEQARRWAVTVLGRVVLSVRRAM